MRSETNTLGVKTFKQDIKSGFIIFLTIVSLSVITVFAANWYDSLTSNAWDPLTATKWNSLVKATVPTWAIMAFNLTACPDTWTEYTPARGRFLRWIDSTWVNDSTRVLWDLQADDFKSHNHTFYVRADSATVWWWPVTAMWVSGRTDTTIINFQSWYWISATWWTETRPKNVAVLYCVKL